MAFYMFTVSTLVSLPPRKTSCQLIVNQKKVSAQIYVMKNKTNAITIVRDGGLTNFLFLSCRT